MGREVRMVPPDWKHPEGKTLHAETWSEWQEQKRQWEAGFVTDYRGGWKPKGHLEKSWEEYAGEHTPDEHMPDFEPGTATHYMMYETCTEGSPISPAFATPEELARWLVANKASAFADMTATYKEWLATIHAGSAVSAVIDPQHGMRSGVAASGDGS